MFTLHFRSLIILFLLVISTVYVVVWNIDWSFGVMIAEGIYLFLFCSLLILAILNMYAIELTFMVGSITVLCVITLWGKPETLCVYLQLLKRNLLFVEQTLHSQAFPKNSLLNSIFNKQHIVYYYKFTNGPPWPCTG